MLIIEVQFVNNYFYDASVDELAKASLTGKNSVDVKCAAISADSKSCSSGDAVLL